MKGAESGMSALAKAMGMAGGTNPAELLRDKLMTGEEAFKGQDPIDSFCGLFDARL